MGFLAMQTMFSTIRFRSQVLVGHVLKSPLSNYATCNPLRQLHELSAGHNLHHLLAQRQHLPAVAAAQAAAFNLQGNLQYTSPYSLAVRSWASASAPQQQTNREPVKNDSPGKEQGFDSLELTQEKINAITDKIPQRPVGIVEGTSYTLLILAAFGVLAFVLYHVVTSLVLEPTALRCFNHTLDRLKGDPRITVRIGSADDIRAWGSNSESRVARQQIPHTIYQDQSGVEHVRIQFYIKGPSGTGLVNADMYKDALQQWQYSYLLVDVYSGSSKQPQRLHIVTPR